MFPPPVSKATRLPLSGNMLNNYKMRNVTVSCLPEVSMFFLLFCSSEYKTVFLKDRPKKEVENLF